MLFDDKTKGIAQAYMGMLGEKTDPVNKKELKGKHSERKDKDIDNDGDVDSSDEYLHNRRKAISKSVKESEIEIEIKNNGKKKDEDEEDDEDEDEDEMVVDTKPSNGKKKEKEQVTELSKDTLTRYSNSARGQARHSMAKLSGASSEAEVNKHSSTMTKRLKGNAMASKRLNKEDVEMDEGLMDKFKAGFSKGMKDSLKKKISPEHHDKYDFDSIKSVNDRMAMFVKAKKAGHIKEEMDETYNSDVKRAFPASSVKTGASAPKGTSYMPKDKKKAMGGPANKMKESYQWNWEAIAEAPEEELDEMIEQMSDDDLESFISELESIEEGNNWYQGSTNSKAPTMKDSLAGKHGRSDDLETLDPRAEADRAFADAHRQNVDVKDYPGKDKPVSNAKPQAPVRPGEKRNSEPMKTLSDIRKR